MARAGWYPDPGGSPDRFRHWDGRRWSDQTTTDPTDPAPSTSASSEPPTRNPRRSLILIAVVLAVVVVVIGVLVVRSALGEGPSAAPAVPSAPGRDDASPGSAAGSPSASPTVARPPRSVATPTHSAGGPSARRSTTPRSQTQWAVQPARESDCDLGDPSESRSDSSDGRIHGGGLSFASPGPEWREGGDSTFWRWAYDLDGVYEVIVLGHNALLWLGRLRDTGQPESAQQEAERIIGCELRSDLDQDLKITDVEKLDEGKIQVDGKPAVDLRVRVAVSNLPVGARGFVYNVIVVPGPGDDSFFIGEIPYPDNRRVSVMDTTVADLSLS